PDELEGRRSLPRGTRGRGRRVPDPGRRGPPPHRSLTPAPSMLTLAIIKPDAVGAGYTGKILAHLEGAGFVIRAARLVKLTGAQAARLYEVHRERPFYRSLVTFMTSGPALALALERDDAVARLREIGRASCRERVVISV